MSGKRLDACSSKILGVPSSPCRGPTGDVGDLDNLEAHTGNITDGMTLTTETGNQDLVVLLNVVQATVTGHEGGDLLAVLDELHPHALADGRVRLLGLDAAVE